MSKKLFVGCRVRILYSNGWPELAGQEGRIVGRIDSGSEAADRGCEWDVAPDCWGTHVAPYLSISGRGLFGPSSKQLEPVTPSGAAPSEHSFTELMDRLKAGEVECV